MIRFNGDGGISLFWSVLTEGSEEGKKHWLYLKMDQYCSPQMLSKYGVDAVVLNSRRRGISRTMVFFHLAIRANANV